MAGNGMRRGLREQAWAGSANGGALILAPAPAQRCARGIARTDPVIANRIAGDVAVSYPGSVPIIVGNDMIGAITVSGSQNNTDEVCADAGLSKIQARLK